MRFRTGLLIGLGVGYVLGTRAGEERAAEVEQWLSRVRDTKAYAEARDRAMQTLGRTQAGLVDLPGARAPRDLGDLLLTDPDRSADPTDLADLPLVDWPDEPPR